MLNAPPLDDLLRTWLQVLSGHQLVRVPEQLDGQLNMLLAHLHQQRCLLVLDNFESILQAGGRAGGPAGRYRPGYEGYGQLLRWIVEHQHSSCLLLTSRERPRELVHAERVSYFVRSLELAGLDLQAGQALLAEQGLQIPLELARELRERYSGNPLALKLVADSIQELFGGDAAAFLGQETPIFDDIREVLDQQFDRLADVERGILTWLAIEREPVSLAAIEEDLALPVSRGEMLTAIHSLQRRSLLELIEPGGIPTLASHGPSFALQNVLMEYTTDCLIEAVYQDILAQQANDLNRFALLKAQAKDYVRRSQERLILQPLAERLLARLGRAGLEVKLRHLLASLQAKAPLAAGYAAGNLLNLLLHLGVNIRGYDFSQVAVWQTYLRGIELHDVDFSGADLTGCAFTDTFGPIIFEAVFSPDGRLLASSSEDQTVRLWDVHTGQCLHTLHGHTGPVWSTCFGPDGCTLASGSGDGASRLWDPPTGACLHTLQGHANWVRSISFNSDGRLLASSSEDQTVRLWDVQTGKCIHILQGHTGSIESLCFSPNDRTLASGGAEGTIRLWDAQAGQCLHILRSDRPYERMNITGATGLTAAQKAALKTLGAVERL